MINNNNIADLFNFIKNQKNNNTFSIKISKKNISITKNKQNADLIVNGENITINTKIIPIVKNIAIAEDF